MKKILAIGSLTSDTFLRPRRQEILEKHHVKYLAFRMGEKIRVDERIETFGGGGANIAVGLSRLGGISASVLGRIGNDRIGKRILENLKQNGVGYSAVQIGKKEASGFSVILSTNSGERTVLFSYGANDFFEDFDPTILPEFDGACLQHLCSNSQQVFQRIHDFFLAHPEKFLSWNPGNESLEKGIDTYSDFLPVVDVLLLNLEEAQAFTGERRVKDIFKAFFHRGFQGRAIVTDGQRGSLGCDGKHIFFCSVDLESTRVDTLGAGDSYMCGVVGATLLGKNLQDALKVGTMNAASVVGHYGAQAGLRSLDELEQVTHNIRVDMKPFSF